MKQNKILLFSLLALGVVKVSAQDASVAAGGDATGPGGSAAYSIGQVMYTSQSGTSGSANYGVQQPYEFLTVGVSARNNISLTMSVYPNPSVSVINLNVGTKDLQGMTLQLFDLQGKLLYAQCISNQETSIKMEEYSTGSYFLKVIGNNQELKTFKIIKN